MALIYCTSEGKHNSWNRKIVTRHGTEKNYSKNSQMWKKLTSMTSEVVSAAFKLLFSCITLVGGNLEIELPKQFFLFVFDMRGEKEDKRGLTYHKFVAVSEWSSISQYTILSKGCFLYLLLILFKSDSLKKVSTIWALWHP